jgi:hypothetical protein
LKLKKESLLAQSVYMTERIGGQGKADLRDVVFSYALPVSHGRSPCLFFAWRSWGLCVRISFLTFVSFFFLWACGDPMEPMPRDKMTIADRPAMA